MALTEAAMRAHRAGDFERAEALVRAALVEDEACVPALVHLAVLYRHQGRFSESRDVAERAIAGDPASPHGYMQAGLSCLGAGLSAEAAVYLGRAVSVAPDLGPAHYNLGLALENLGRPEEAKERFREAIRLDPRDERARMSLGALLLAEEDEVGASTQAEAALRVNPRADAPYLLKARVAVFQGKGAEAEAYIRQALSLDAGNAFGHTMLGFRLLQTGDFAEAEREFERSLDLDPAQGTAFFGITQARRITVEDKALVARMRRTLQEIPLTYAEAGYLHFALAKAYENLREYGSAMSHCDEAHRNQKLAQFGAEEFDAAQYAAEMDAVAHIYSAERMGEPAAKFDSSLPIFIVGMMRSGTTLTEQILSSHSMVGAAGEVPFWVKRRHLCEDLPSGTVDDAQAVRLAREYCRLLRQIAPNARRVTDKLPGNYARLGLLHRVLPGAKIVHCRRDPVDTALSIYMTPNPTAPLFAHSRAGIVEAYRAYDRIMRHWRATLPPGAIFDLRYEDLIASPEETIRSLLEFLELPWEDACLSHDRNAKDVRTPSLWQVRQPLYSSSIGRAKRYEGQLGELASLADLS